MDDIVNNNKHVQPVFFKHTQLFPDLENRKRENNIVSVLDVCRAAAKTIGDEHIFGAQKIRNLWRIYTTNKEFRTNLLVSGISLRTMSINLYDLNPYSNRITDVENQPDLTKITIRDVPLSYANSVIEKFFKTKYPHVNFHTDLTFSCERDEKGDLTDFRNGDRFFKTSATLDPPLDRNVTIGIWKARLFHFGQTRIKCKICGHEGHRPGSQKCSASKENTNVTTVSGPANLLSNFHPTPVEIYNHVFDSREHAYVYIKAESNGLQEEADSVFGIGHA